MEYLKREQVIFSLEVLPEDSDPAKELEFEDDAKWVCEGLEAGNEWAWCCVKVTAIVQHPTKECEVLEAHEYLGQCMYDGREDFIKNSGYYEEMKDAAFDSLAADWRGWM